MCESALSVSNRMATGHVCHMFQICCICIAAGDPLNCEVHVNGVLKFISHQTAKILRFCSKTKPVDAT